MAKDTYSDKDENDVLSSKFKYLKSDVTSRLATVTGDDEGQGPSKKRKLRKVMFTNYFLKSDAINSDDAEAPVRE